jgi:hypothetical protein
MAIGVIANIMILYIIVIVSLGVIYYLVHR